MKLIKLDRRHTFYKDGFRWAFKGSAADNHRMDIEKYLERVYGHHDYLRCSHWFASFTKSKMVVASPYGGYYKARIYYIALRNEADITMLLLSGALDENN